MKRVLRNACLLLIAIVLCLSAVTAQAATVSKDGLQITLRTDKTEYGAGETIGLSLTITNLNDAVVKPLSVDYLVPQTCALAQNNGLNRELAVLNGNETLTLDTTVVVIPEPETVLPQTGDDAHLALWCLLAAVSLLSLYRFSAEKRRRLTALLLCAALLAPALPGCTAAAKAENADFARVTDGIRSRIERGETGADLTANVRKIAATESIMVMGVQTEVSAVVTYEKSDVSSALMPYASLLDKPLEETLTDKTTIKYDMSMDDDGFVLPESPHNYPSGVDYLYYLDGGAGTESLSIHFGSVCEMEYSFDALIIYDGDGQYVTCYTGTEMRDAVATVEGGGVIIRLVSDSSVTKYGFYLDEVIPHRKPEITSCSVSASGKVVVRWNKLYGYSGYIVERAPVTSDGSIGTYTAVDNASTSSVSSFIDSNVVMGRCYAYRVRQHYEIGDVSYISSYSVPVMVYCIGQPVLTSGATQTVDGSPAIVLKWSAAAGAEEYRIYRSETESGTYEQVGTTTGTTFTDLLPEKKHYYYKVRGYVEYGGQTYTGLTSAAQCYGYITAPSTVNIRSASTSSIVLSWSDVPIADGYAVFRSMTRTGTYTCIAKTTATSGTFAPARSNGMSFYKVRAYTITNGKYTYSEDSKIMGIYALDTPTGLTATENADKSIRITWDPVDNAQSYKIYYSSAQNGTYTECGTTSVKGKTLTTVPTTLSTVYLKVRSMRTDGSVTSASNLSSAVKVTRAVNPITVRNLYVFEENIPNANPIRTYEGDMELLNSMFSKASPYGRPVTTLSYRDLTKTQILSKISSMANLADSNDITTFFLSCHGANGITTGSQAGMLALSCGSWMTFEELATALKEIPGRVVIILTSCGSGSSIGGALGNGNGEEVEFDEEMFMKEFIDVFSKFDEKVYVAPEEEMTGGAGSAEQPATGELIVANKFYVITAARGGENGFYYQDGHTILLEWMDNGVMGADSDGNDTVTLGEMETHLTELGNTTQIGTSDGYEYMHPLTYPSGSTFPLFLKR